VAMPPAGAARQRGGGSAAAQLAEIKREVRHLRIAASERTLAESECAELDRDVEKLNSNLEDVARRIAAEETRMTELNQLLQEKESAVTSPVKQRMDDPATLQRTVDQLKRRNAALKKALTKFSDPKLGQQEEDSLATILLEIEEAEKKKALAESNLRKLTHQVNQQQRLAQTADRFSAEKRAEMAKTQEAYVKRLESVLESTRKSKQASLDRDAALDHEWDRWLQLLMDVAERVKEDSEAGSSELAKKLREGLSSTRGTPAPGRKNAPAHAMDIAGMSPGGAILIDALRHTERQRNELKKRGTGLLQEEKQLEEKLETLRKRIAAQREKLAPSSPIVSGAATVAPP